MNSTSCRVAAVLLAAWLASLWPAAGKAAAQGPAPAQEEAGEEAPAPGLAGALEIRLASEEDRMNPPAEMVLTGPGQRRTGYDVRSGGVFQEIPGSSYEWEGSRGGWGPREVIIRVSNPASGLYSLRLIATRTGKYRLYMRGLDREQTAADLRFTDAKILKGTEQHYLINFSPEGPRLDARRTPSRE